MNMAIKKLQNDFTTPEQSKRLLELGVPADSADCYYSEIDHYTHPVIWHSDVSKLWGTKCPCWSVGRLIKIDNICSIQKIKDAGFHLIGQDFEDLVETIIQSLEMKEKHYWLDFSKLEE